MAEKYILMSILIFLSALFASMAIKRIKYYMTLAFHFKRQRDNLIEFVKNAQVTSGVCCCGEDMQRHSNPMDCGHSPRDQWDYLVQCRLEQIEQEDKKMEEKNA